MRDLGICRTSGSIYTGSVHAGVPVDSGSNLLLPIAFDGIEENQGAALATGFPSLVFRELSFDPITKLRRGQVYKMYVSQPLDWHVHEPYRKDLEQVAHNKGAAQKLELISYQAYPLVFLSKLTRLPNVIIGDESSHSFWSIVSIESQLDKSKLLTLKSIRSLGVIPDFDITQFSSQAQPRLLQALENVELSANRLAPLDTVDRCRDALSIIFGDLAGDQALDLGAGLRKYNDKNKAAGAKGDGQDLISKNAEIVRALHSRGKPNESHRYSTRPVDEQDASLAIDALGFVLKELGSRHVR